MHELFFTEIVDLHRFIENWLIGSVPKAAQVFSRFEGALDEDFKIVHPSGKAEDRNQLVNSFWSAHGTVEDLSLEIRNMGCRISNESFALVSYEEWQFGRTTTARLSSVVFRIAEGGTELKWAHLHETWLPV